MALRSSDPADIHESESQDSIGQIRPRSLAPISAALTSSMDLHRLLDAALSSTMDVLRFSAGLIALFDEQTGNLELFTHIGIPASVVEGFNTDGLRDGPWNVLVQKGESFSIEDFDQLTSVGEDLLLRADLESCTGAPIVHKERVLGAICLFGPASRTVTEDDCAVVNTIGQQIAAAVENVRLLDQSRRRRLYLEAVLSAAPDAIITLDAEHHIAEWNAGAERLFGYSREEVLGKKIDPLIATPTKLEEAAGFTERVMGGGDLAPVEAVRYRKDGSPVHVLVAGSPIRIDDEFAGGVAVYTDIGDLKDAQEALRQHAAELEARNEELDTFAHTVAHDLKSPLQDLIGYADLLSEQYEALSPDIRKEAVRTILSTADRMHNIIRELLLLAEVRRGEVATRPLDMAAIVATARERLAYVIDEYEADVLAPKAWPAALGHPAWIEEVWANYLGNAIKYGGCPPRVELGATSRPDGTVRFWVRDNGRGLTSEQQAMLFTPFTRLHQAQAGGHGLGLSIVRRIVDKLGGEVGVESGPGEGSTFFFTLPKA